MNGNVVGHADGNVVGHADGHAVGHAEENKKKQFELLPDFWKERCGHLLERKDIQMISEKPEFIGVALPLRLYQSGYKAIRLGKILILLYNIWEFPAIQKLSEEDKINLCINIELSCYMYTLEKAREDNVVLSWSSVNFRNYYHEICAKLIANFDSRIAERNEYLINAVLSKKIPIMNLPKLHAYELCPEKYEDIINKINKAKDISFTIKTTSLFTCRKCHARECKTENRQNRSLDEGVNLTITCMNCQHTWNG